MWKKCREWLAGKIDVKITGYIALTMFVLELAALIKLIADATACAGSLPVREACAGFGIVLAGILGVVLSVWGQKQTGRKLRLNRAAAWLNAGMAVVMGLIYVMGAVI